eukprot:350064-Chlamydomonas_euryale.AAC.2
MHMHIYRPGVAWRVHAHNDRAAHTRTTIEPGAYTRTTIEQRTCHSTAGAHGTWALKVAAYRPNQQRRASQKALLLRWVAALVRAAPCRSSHPFMQESESTQLAAKACNGPQVAAVVEAMARQRHLRARSVVRKSEGQL